MARAQTPLCCLSHEGHIEALKTQHCPPTLKSLLFVVECEMSPIGSRIRTLTPPLSPSLLVLFGKITEPLGGGAWLEEVCPWGRAVRGHRLVPLPVLYFPAAKAVWWAGFMFPNHAFPTATDCALK